MLDDAQEAQLRQRLSDTQKVLGLTVRYIRELERDLGCHVQNPPRLVPNGLLSALVDGAKEHVKRRGRRRKAERATAKEAVSKYRAAAARAANTD